MNWLKENIGYKNILVLAIVVVVIVGLVKGPSLYRHIKKSRFDGSTKAFVENIEEKKRTSQHHNGANIKTVGYEITYVYEVERDKYSSKGFVEPGSEVKKLFDRFSAGDSCLIDIGYLVENPNESIIIRLINPGK